MTTHETNPDMLRRNLGRRYYRLALSAAVRRDLSGAVTYARYAVMLDGEHRDAEKLLLLCRRELGEGGGTEGFSDDTEERLEKVKTLAAGRKWRQAARAVRTVPVQSVRVLNVQGCLWALAGNYAEAAGCFARALRKDRGSRIAAEAMAAAVAELTLKRKRFWGIWDIWGKSYEKPV
jgi:tetratricopeptide (TPR) repeat protein